MLQYTSTTKFNRFLNKIHTHTQRYVTEKKKSLKFSIFNRWGKGLKIVRLEPTHHVNIM